MAGSTIDDFAEMQVVLPNGAVGLKDRWWVRLWRWVTRQPQRRLVFGVDFGTDEDTTTVVTVRDNGNGTHTVLDVREIER